MMKKDRSAPLPSSRLQDRDLSGDLKTAGDSGNEDFFRKIVAAIPDIIIRTDCDGVIQYVNDIAIRQGGFRSPSDIIGQNVLSLIVPEDRARAAENIRSMFDKPLGPQEYGLVLAAGVRLQYEVNGDALRDSDGNPTGVIIICRDVTERKAAEEALRESTARFEGFAENTDYGFGMAELDGLIVYANTALSRMVGESNGVAMIGKYIRDYTPPNIFSKIQNLVIPSILQTGRWSGELELKTVDGRRVPTREEYFIIRDRGGRSRFIADIITDISERRDADRNLQESESKFRNVFNSSRDAIVVTKNGLHVFQNRAYGELYGYSTPEALEGRPVLDLVAPSRRPEIADYIVRRNRGELTPSLYETRGLRRDGTEFDIEIQASIFVFQEETHILAIIREITERKKAEERLHRSFMELRETLRGAIKSLSAAIEIRDPYTGGHQERVTRIASAIALDMGMDEDTREGLQIAGTVHDIGKLVIPAEILSKPSKLSPMEYALVQTHSRAGFDILDRIKFPWPVAQIVLQHHERLDGSGYPQGLHGPDILLEARILCVADVVEAMSSHRPYRASLGVAAALDEVDRGKGILFDADVVAACRRVFVEKKVVLD
jgi:PAS domain S-box-containing protein